MSALVVDRLVLVGVAMEQINEGATRPPLDDFYTPERVRDLLRLYVYLADSRPPRDADMSGLVRRMFGPDGWQTEAIAKRSDIYRALVWLQGRSVEMQYVVRCSYAVGLEVADILPYVRKYLHTDATEMMIANWRDDGIKLMSDFLCGRVK